MRARAMSDREHTPPSRMGGRRKLVQTVFFPVLVFNVAWALVAVVLLGGLSALFAYMGIQIIAGTMFGAEWRGNHDKGFFLTAGRWLVNILSPACLATGLVLLQSWMLLSNDITPQAVLDALWIGIGFCILGSGIGFGFAWISSSNTE